MGNIYFSFINKWDYIYIKNNDEANLKKSLFYNFMKYTKFDKAVIFYNQNLINQLEINDDNFEKTIKEFISNENIETDIVKISDDNNSDSFFEEIYDSFKNYIYDKDSRIYLNGKTGSPTLREVFNFIASFNSNTKVIDYNKPRDERIEKKNRFNKIGDNHTDSSFLYKLKVQNSYNYTELFKHALETGNVNEAKEIFDTYNLFNGDSIIKDSLDFLIENQFLDNTDFQLNQNNESAFREKINILYNKYLTNDKKRVFDNSVAIMCNIFTACSYYNAYKLGIAKSSETDLTNSEKSKFYNNMFVYPKPENQRPIFDKITFKKDVYNLLSNFNAFRGNIDHKRIKAKDEKMIHMMREEVSKARQTFNNIEGEKCLDYYSEIKKRIRNCNIFESYEQATNIDNNDVVDLVGFAGYNDPYNGRDGSEGSILNIYNTLKNNDVKIENVYLIVTNGIYKGICLEDEVKDKSILELFKESFNDSYVHIIPFDDNMIVNKNIDENLCYDTEDNDDFSDKSILFNRIYDFIMKIKSNNKIVLSGSSGAPDLQNVMKIIPSLVDNTYCYYRKIDGKGTVENEPREEVIAEYIKVFDYNNVYINARYKNMLNQAIKDRDIVTIKLISDILNKNNNMLEKIYSIYNGSFSNEFENYDLVYKIERYKLRYLHIKAYNDNHNNKIDYSNCVRGIQSLYQELFESQIKKYRAKVLNKDNKNIVEIIFTGIKRNDNGKKLIISENRNLLQEYNIDSNSEKIKIVSPLTNQNDIKTLSYDNILRLIENEENQFSEEMIKRFQYILNLRNTIEHPKESTGIKNALKSIYQTNDLNEISKHICMDIDEVLIDMYNIQNYDNPDKVDIEKELKEYYDIVDSCKNILDM